MKFWRGEIGAGGTRLSDGYDRTGRPEATDRIRPVCSEQVSEALPSIMSSYFDAPAGGPTYYGILKRWTGAAWVKEPCKRWTGAAWVAAVLKRWSGTAWLLVDTTGV